jgi:hypothetical protein
MDKLKIGKEFFNDILQIMILNQQNPDLTEFISLSNEERTSLLISYYILKCDT